MENELVIDNDQFSEMSEEESVSNVGDPICVQDGGLGELDDEHIKNLIVENADVKKLIKTIKRSVKYTPHGLKRIILFSGGNLDISARGYGVDGSLMRGRRSSTITNMVRSLMDKLEKFNREVVDAGGRLILTSLIPRPEEVDPSVSRHSAGLQRLLSDAFVKTNNEFYAFNKSIQVTTPHIKGFVEEKTQRTKKGKLRENRIFYSGREQRVIKLSSYQSDLIHIKDEVRIKMVELVKKIVRGEDSKLRRF